VSLPSFSIRQVVLVNLLFAVLMLTGVMVARRIPVDVFPDISFNTAVVVTTWTGASPEEMERLVTTKLEDEIDGIVGIKEMFSFSSQDLSEINVEWEETLSEVEYEAALNDLRAAIDRVDDLPVDAETPILTELSVSEVYNVAMVAVTDVGGVGEYTLREVARDLQERLERIPGLRKAELRGDRDRELRVLVDKHRAAQYGLTLRDLHDVIVRNNQNFPGGSFTDPDDREVTVRGLGQFVSPEQLAETIVRKDPDGHHVRLADVATVESGFAKRRLSGRHDGHPAIVMGISKEARYDVVELVDRVEALLARAESFLPPGIEARITLDTSEYVESRMEIMRSNLVLGVVLVIFILWLTVGFRNALLAIVGVPFSFLVAMALFPIFGITINSLSLIGFIMVSGMIVDDAIIILENIYRRIEAGEPLAQATIRGTEEVMWPVSAAIFTTIAAFLPMLTISGTSGEFMSILPKTVIACLLGSLLEALVVLPAHYLDWGSRRSAGDSLERAAARPVWQRASYVLRARVDGAIVGLRARYLALQARVLTHRYAFLAFGLGAFVFAAGLFRHVPVDLFPGDFNQLMVAIETPRDYGVEQTDRVVRGVEEALEPLRHELLDVMSYSGFSMDADEVPLRGPNYGILFLSFPNTHENIADPDRILRLVRQRLEREYWPEHRGDLVTLRVMPPRNGPPIGKPVAIRIQSDDYGVAKQIAGEMKAELATLAGVHGITDNTPLGPRELRVELDEHRASLHGLTFDDVGFALMAANEGVVPSTFKDPDSDEDVDIRVLLQADQRTSVADLLDVEVRTPGGYLVKLGDVAHIEVTRGFQRLYHFGARRAVVVYADVDGVQATSTSANEYMARAFADVPDRYPGVNVVFGGEFQATDQAMADLRIAMLIAVFSIYGILAAQFRSYLQPFIVMSVIVLSFIGVAVGMWAMNELVGRYAISMYVFYALVGLAGIVVNDSLVLIDFVNQERGRGSSTWDSVRIASEKRFRPILLTTLTTVAGLLPMATGMTGYSPVFGPFATAIVFGLAAASGLTLFVVPVFYLILDEAKGASGRLARRARGREASVAPVAGGRDL
jgi:HAE1 family hydrophobic/amphiphilic exporter-1